MSGLALQREETAAPAPENGLGGKIAIGGRIIKGVGGLYEVRPFSHRDGLPEILLCRARGVFRHEKLTPLPGDCVRVLPGSPAPAEQSARTDSVDYVIEEILPRRNALIRPPLANLTHLFVVIPATRPQPDLLTVDKLISIAEYSGIEPVIVVNKADLAPDEAARILSTYHIGGFAAFALSAASGEGVDALRDCLGSLCGAEPVVAAFSGASGAGKSTLLGRLFQELHPVTGAVSRKTERGRHTTRAVELFPVSLAEGTLLLADTPGFSMLDFTRFNFYPSSELPGTFREFRPYLGKCRYTRCTHTREDECAVLAAVRAGQIGTSRHESYCTMVDDFRKKPDWQRRKEGLLHD